MVEINLKIITKENVEPLILPTEKQMRFVDFLLYLQEMFPKTEFMNITPTRTAICTLRHRYISE